MKSVDQISQPLFVHNAMKNINIQIITMQMLVTKYLDVNVVIDSFMLGVENVNRMLILKLMDYQRVSNIKNVDKLFIMVSVNVCSLLFIKK
jgi:hypothetical protein